MKKHLLSAIGGVALGLALGQCLPSQQRLERTELDERARGELDSKGNASANCPSHLSQRDLDAIRDMVATRQPAGAGPTEQDYAAAAPDEERIAASAEAAEEARALIESAHHAGEWSEAHLTEFRKVSEDLVGADRQAVLSSLVSALNSQQIRVTVRGAPF